MDRIKSVIKNAFRIIIFFELILALGGYFSIFNDSTTLDLYRQIYLANLITTVSAAGFELIFYKGRYLVAFILPLLTVVVFNPFYPWIIGSFNLFLLVIVFISFLALDFKVLRMNSIDGN